MNLVDEAPGAIRTIMGKCVIVRAECLFATYDISYVALCDDFDEVPAFQQTPEYRPLFKKGLGLALFVGWEKLGGK